MSQIDLIRQTSNSKNLLDKLTIVIPSINRGFLLERSIEYWRNIPVKVHIVDGSEVAQFAVADFRDTENISYHHAHFSDEKWSNFFSVMNFASKLPTTKYSAICGDDDFFTYSGLISCLESLEKSDSVDAALGRVAYFRESSAPRKSSMKGLNHRSTPLQSSSNLLDREVGKSPWLMYGIVKTEMWSKLLQISYAERLPHIGLHELLVRELSWIMCRTSLNDQLLSIRQFTIPGSNIGESVKINDWLVEARNVEVKNQIKEKLLVGLNFTNTNYPQSAGEKLCDDVLAKYMKVLKSDKVAESNGKILKQTLLKFVPRNVKVAAMFFLNTGYALQATTFRLPFFLLYLSKARIPHSRSEVKTVARLLCEDHDRFGVRAISR